MRIDPSIPDRCSALGRGVLFAILLFVPLVFTSSTLEAFETPKVALLVFGAIVLAGLAIVSAIERRQQPALPRDGATLGAALVLASAALSTVRSLSPHVSFFGDNDSHAGLMTVLAYFSLVIATRSFVRTASQACRLLTAVALGAGIAAAYAVLQTLRLDPYPWGASSSVGGFVRPFSTLGHANFLGGYLVMATPIAAAAAWRTDGRWRWLGWCNVATIVLAIGLSLSRGAWIALILLAMIGGVMAARSGQRRRIGLAIGAATMATVAVLPAAGPTLLDGLKTRLLDFANGAGRLELWRSGWVMARDYPVTGVGLDAFSLAFGQHRPEAFWAVGWNETPTRAHNEIVHILATQGIVGLLALAALVVGGIYSARLAWRRSSDRALVFAVIGGLVAFAIQSQFSFTVAATGSLAAALLGMLSRLAVAAEPAVKPVLQPRWPVRIGIGLAFGGVGWFGVGAPLASDMQCRRGDCTAIADPVLALREYEAAVLRSPERDLFWFKLGQGARAAARGCGDSALRESFNRRALEAQARGIALVPASPTHRAHYARLLAEIGPELSLPADAVLNAFRDALVLDPDNPMLLADAGHAAWACKQFDQSRRWLIRGRELDPEQANLRALLGTVAMTQGHFEEAEHHYESAAMRDWHGNEDGQMQSMTVWAACLVQLRRPIQAEQVLRIVVAHRPDWVNARYTLGYACEMLDRRGEAAEEYRRVLAAAPHHALGRQAAARLAAMWPAGK